MCSVTEGILKHLFCWNSMRRPRGKGETICAVAVAMCFEPWLCSMSPEPLLWHLQTSLCMGVATLSILSQLCLWGLPSHSTGGHVDPCAQVNHNCCRCSGKGLLQRGELSGRRVPCDDGDRALPLLPEVTGISMCHHKPNFHVLCTGWGSRSL